MSLRSVPYQMKNLLPSVCQIHAFASHLIKHLFYRSFLFIFYDGTHFSAQIKNFRRFSMIWPFDNHQTSTSFDPIELADATKIISANSIPTILRLAPALALEVTEQLPKASHADLLKIVEHRLTFLSPWQPDDVYFRVTDICPIDNNQVQVKYFIVQKRTVEAALATLSKFNLNICFVDILGKNFFAKPCFDLRCQKTRRHSKTVNIFAYIFFSITMIAIALYFFFEGNEYQLSYLERKNHGIEIDEALSYARALISERNKAEERLLVVSNRFAHLPPIIVVMDQLSQIIPRDTFLEEIRIEGGEISLFGYSKNAAALALYLESSPFFESARLIDYIRQNELGESDIRLLGKERFSMKLSYSDE